MLFLGPAATAIVLQWYIYTVVSVNLIDMQKNYQRAPQTTTSVRIKAIATQVVFEHALRVRMKAETHATEPAHPSIASPKTAGTALPAEGTTDEQHPSGSVVAIDAEVGDGAPLRVSDASPLAASESDKDEPMPQESAGGASNLVGRINNLVTTDLQMLDNGRDFMALREFFLRFKRRNLSDLR